MRTVHLAVYDGLADWEPGYAVAHLNDPEHQRVPHRVRTVGAEDRPVTTAGGLRVSPDLTLDALDPAGSAMLILPGAQGWDHGEHGAFVEAARAFLAAGTPVAAICGATAGLARAGLLDDRSHTSNALEYLGALPGYAGADSYVDAPAVTDGDLITAGAMHPVGFAREIFARLELYEPAVIEAWHGLFSTGDAAWYARLMAAAGAPA